MIRNKKSVLNSKQENINWASIAPDSIKELNLMPPFKIADERCNKVFNDWVEKFKDDWINETANIGVGNSIAQYSNFVIDRLNYSDCAVLATDSIINNAINKYGNEILRRGGKIKLDIENIEAQADIEKQLNERLKELNFWELLKEAITTSLTYGGALIFIDTNTDKLDKPLYEQDKILKINKIKGLRVVPPYLMGASEVETTNPLNYDFMKPKQWYIAGNATTIDATRFLKLVMFEAPVLLKPLYNFMGISLCQFMRNYVSSADIARQALSDIFLRFKTTIIKSDMVKINALEAKERALSINRQFNNLGSLLVTKDEEIIQTITPLSGLDKIVAQMQENIAVSARMPAVKLLGLTPSGFNATGEFDLNSYYDEIMSIQNAVIKPLIERVLRLLCLEMEQDLRPEYEFEIIQKISEAEKTANSNAEADFIAKLIQNGLLTQEQSFEYLKDKGLIKAEVDFMQGDDEFANEMDGEGILDNNLKAQISEALDGTNEQENTENEQEADEQEADETENEAENTQSNKAELGDRKKPKI